MTTYFSFAIADSMFDNHITSIQRRDVLTLEQAKVIIKKGVTPCHNPSHTPTIEAMRKKFGIEVSTPEKPPIVQLKVNDKVIVMSVRGLPRLENRHEYTHEEIDKADFKFTLWTVISGN